jgi:hypothetical protein
VVDVRIDAVSATAIIAGPPDARLDAVSATVILKGAADARIDTLGATVIIGISNLEMAPLTLTALEVFPIVEPAPLVINVDVTVFGTGAGVAGMPWIPAGVVATVGSLWLQDGIASDTVVGGGWGVIVMINP